MDVKYLTRREVLALFPNATEREYPAGQIVVYQGDEPSHVFYVAEGALKYYDIDQNGNEKILHIIGQQGLFPMFYAFGTYSEVHAFYSSLSDLKVILIPVDDFKLRAKNDPALSNILLRWFVHETQYIVQRIKSLEKSDARVKVMEALLYLASRHATSKRSGWHSVDFAVSQQFLGDLTGLTRETVSMALKDLEPEKLVRYPKQRDIEIHKERLEHCINNL